MPKVCYGRENASGFNTLTSQVLAGWQASVILLKGWPTAQKGGVMFCVMLLHHSKSPNFNGVGYYVYGWASVLELTMGQL